MILNGHFLEGLGGGGVAQVHRHSSQSYIMHTCWIPTPQILHPPLLGTPQILHPYPADSAPQV
jgi:hypothetical protein